MPLTSVPVATLRPDVGPSVRMSTTVPVGLMPEMPDTVIVAFTLWFAGHRARRRTTVPTLAAFLFSDTTCALVPTAFWKWTTSAPRPPSAAYADTSRRIESTEPGGVAEEDRAGVAVVRPADRDPRVQHVERLGTDQLAVAVDVTDVVDRAAWYGENENTA